MKLVCGENKILTPSHSPGFLLLGLALQCIVLLTDGIKISNVTVPPVALIGQSLILECGWILEKDTLYTLKWYKDGHEYYRFSPSSRPNMITFPVEGVQADKQPLNANVAKITLRNLSLKSTGTYRCEISSESPLFQTLSEEKNLTVIVPPDPLNPRLSKFPSTVYMSDIINGNCTSKKSFPPANITFFLNDSKWTGGSNGNILTVYQPVSEIRSDGLEVFTSVLGFGLKVESNHFFRGAIRIKCVASILNIEWESKKTITHKNYHSAGRNQYSSGSQGPKSSSWYSWAFTLCCLFTRLGMSEDILSVLSLEKSYVY